MRECGRGETSPSVSAYGTAAEASHIPEQLGHRSVTITPPAVSHRQSLNQSPLLPPVAQSVTASYPISHSTTTTTGRLVSHHQSLSQSLHHHQSLSQSLNQSLTTTTTTTGPLIQSLHTHHRSLSNSVCQSLITAGHSVSHSLTTVTQSVTPPLPPVCSSTRV